MFDVKLGPGLFRVILALLVVASHLSSFDIGRPAVFAFFILSGYWVLKMYDGKYRAYGSVWIFYQSRFLRIWLPFAASFLIFFALLSVYGPEPSVRQLLGLSLLGVATHGRDIVGTTWSLDIEVQFYLLVPLIWTVFHMGAKRRSLVFATLLSLGTVALMAVGWYVYFNTGLNTFLMYLPTFVMGAAIWHFRILFSSRAAFTSLGVFLILGGLVAAFPETRPFLISNQPRLFEGDWFAMAWVAVLFPFIAWNVRQGTGPFDMHLGNFSYSLYVVHWPLILLLRNVTDPLSITDKAGIFGLILLASTVFYVIVDRSCERFRAYYIRRLRKGLVAMPS